MTLKTAKNERVQAKRKKTAGRAKIISGEKASIFKNFEKCQIGVIGAGKLGEVIIAGLISQDPSIKSRLLSTTDSNERAEYVKKKHGVKCGADNIALAKSSDIIILSVKPQNVAEVLNEIKPYLDKTKLLVSVAAGVTIFYMESFLKDDVAVIRTMPNLCCQVGAGMTAISKGTHANNEHVELAKKIFEPISRIVVIDEKHIDAVTGLSGSGPAYIYIAIEALAEGGVKVGLPRDVAILLAAQTTLGAAKMVLETQEHPAKLKDMVTTPAGVTIDGIMELEEGKFRVTLLKAVLKGAERAKELVKN